MIVIVKEQYQHSVSPYFCYVYSKQQAQQLRQQFWIAFGQYMQPVPSAGGEHAGWLNYKTGVKNIYFRMNAGNKSASIAIEITHKDEALQALYFKQFMQMQNLLHQALHEEWIWTLHTRNEHGKIISLIYTEKAGVNIFNKNDWPELISFFKPRILALDEFWSTAKYAFEAME